MTKTELIELLSEVDDDQEIYVQVPTGNYWGMIKAKPVQDAAFEFVRYSDYLQSLEVLDQENDEFSSQDDDVQQVYVIKF